jgi:hypothetical protein
MLEKVTNSKPFSFDEHVIDDFWVQLHQFLTEQHSIFLANEPNRIILTLTVWEIASDVIQYT